MISHSYVGYKTKSNKCTNINIETKKLTHRLQKTKWWLQEGKWVQSHGEKD